VLAGLEIAPADGVPDADCEAGCAFTAIAKIAARNAQMKMIVPNRFTKKLPFSPHGLPQWVKPDCGSERPKSLPCREKIHKHFLEFFRPARKSKLFLAQRFRRFASVAQCPQTQGIVAFGQPHAGFIEP
jgi:hypothetical protein